MSFYLFKTAGVLEILAYLSNYPDGRRKVDIRKDLHLNASTAIKAQQLLANAGLLKGIGYADAMTFTLTEHGKNVANKINEIDDILEKCKENNTRNGNMMVFELRQDSFKSKSQDLSNEKVDDE
ncbi:MAG TPA: hypothetical protein VKM55_00400 [Candidatus Lokiarchaeia archaeon]|nr:hypothetical protein [Candidatus Lokiarchaeia archaeon]